MLNKIEQQILSRAAMWLGKAHACGVHNDCVLPESLDQTIAMVEMLLNGIKTSNDLDNLLCHRIWFPTVWKSARKFARKRFDGSDDLFNTCWREYIGHCRGVIDNPRCLADIMGWLEALASEKVNNPDSRFYIYG